MTTRLESLAAELLQHHIGTQPSQVELVVIEQPGACWCVGVVLQAGIADRRDARRLARHWQRLSDRLAATVAASPASHDWDTIAHRLGRLLLAHQTLTPDPSVVVFDAAELGWHGVALIIDSGYPSRMSAWCGVTDWGWRGLVRDIAAMLRNSIEVIPRVSPEPQAATVASAEGSIIAEQRHVEVTR